MATVTVLTDLGEAWVVDNLQGPDYVSADYIGWGTGAGTADKADTTLSTELSLGYTRQTGVRTQPTASSIQWVGTYTNGVMGKTITNCGNFTTVTNGTLVVHSSFDGILLSGGDTLETTITITVA
jgi:hypothetical protein